MINILELVEIAINTLVRIAPLAFYMGSIIAGALFNDFRAVILLGGFMINEFLAQGFRMIFKGEQVAQCALMISADDSPFILPAPIAQTIGFLFGFIVADMYYSDQFYYAKFFTILAILVLTIYSRVNIGCKTLIDAIYCGLIGTMLGIVYYACIKDYYKADYLKDDSGV
jgi:hypothetical protein